MIQLLTARGKEDNSIHDFMDSNKVLNGKIGVFKINFNKNLRRF